MDRDKIPRAYDLAARREREFRKERAEREARGRPREVEDGFQPSMLTFKAFLQTQDDSITDGEALEKYGEYKLEFQRQQLNEFFVSHKSEEWFRIKYQPEARAARQVELQARLSARLAAFTELLREGGDFCEVTVEEEQAELLVQLLDRTVGMLENSEQPMEGDSDGHRTTSVFIASVHPSVTRAELEGLGGKFPGFLRLAISDPDPSRQFYRKCWMSFERSAKIREICFSLNSQKIREHEVKAVVNKDLSKRVRPSEMAHCIPRVVEASVEACKRLIRTLDYSGGLYKGEGEANPVLEDVHLEPTRVLDRLVLYLRLVHSYDWYSQGIAHHPQEDEMPNRLGLLHVRPSGEKQATDDEEVDKVVAKLEDRTETFIKERESADSAEAVKLGLKVEADEVEKFMSASMQELEKDKWLCTISQKKFKAPEFVRKHILNKFGDQVDEVKMDVEFFNNYIRDDKRPSMPLAPPSLTKRGQEEPRQMKRTVEMAGGRREFQDQPPAKRSIKERLGNGGVRVTHAARDPRAIVDYSDVDSFAVVDFDF